MQGTELLRDPDFAQTLEQSPFQANDLPGLSNAVADAFERLPPEQRKELKAALDELDDLTEEELQSFLRMIDYVEKNPDQYPKLVEQLVASGAFEREDVPAQYDPTLMAVVKALIGQAIRRVSAVSSPTYAKGGIVSLKKEAKRLEKAGRNGDSMLAHITPFEATMLKRMGGSGTINPTTGLPEFFLKSLGKILKVGAQIVATAVLSSFVGPVAAGAIVGGVSALLSGAKPADALKSALIGGVTGGIAGGISSSLSGGSFMEGAFSGGSLFGSGPPVNPVLDYLKSTSVGGNLLGGVPSTAGVESGASAGATAFTGAAEGAPAYTSVTPPVRPEGAVLAPDIPVPKAASSGLSGFFGKGGTFDTYKVPLLLGGGAALLAADSGKKEEIKPSLVAGPTGTQLLAQQPGTYGFNQANFAPRVPQAGTPVFPGGGYVAPTTQLATAPVPNFGQITFPKPSMSGIMAAKAGGHISGPGHGTSDSIPARLSDGEFVMTAKAVRGAGNGSRMKGARKMYELMNKFERMA
jgi:hypothetical protein